jgi:hypothetical protein
MLTYDSIDEMYSLLAKGDIRHPSDFTEFIAWLMPWIDAPLGQFIGYQRHQEEDLPTLIVKT